MLRFLIFLLIECSKYLVWHRCTDNISTNGSPLTFNLVKVEDDVTKEGHEDKNLDGEQEVVLENIQIHNHF